MLNFQLGNNGMGTTITTRSWNVKVRFEKNNFISFKDPCKIPFTLYQIIVRFVDKLGRH